VADDALENRDQGEHKVAVAPQPVDEIRLGGLAERLLEDGADGVPIGGLLGTD
jgi:hypothetical protein